MSVTQWPLPIQDFVVISLPSVLIIMCLGAWIKRIVTIVTNLWCSVVHRRLGRHQSVLVFVFSSVVAFVGNSSIRWAIFIQCLGCSNIEKLMYTLSTSKPYFVRARSFSVITINAMGGAICWSCIWAPISIHRPLQLFLYRENASLTIQFPQF